MAGRKETKLDSVYCERLAPILTLYWNFTQPMFDDWNIGVVRQVQLVSIPRMICMAVSYNAPLNRFPGINVYIGLWAIDASLIKYQ